MLESSDLVFKFDGLLLAGFDLLDHFLEQSNCLLDLLSLGVCHLFELFKLLLELVENVVILVDSGQQSP